MADNIFSVFEISGKGLSVQRQRLAATAKNIANANTTRGADGSPYRREVVIVKSSDSNKFESEVKSILRLENTSESHIQSGGRLQDAEASEFNLTAMAAKDTSPPRLVYDPSHPDADEDGYVKIPNINIVTEMVEMISAQRAFEANATVIEAAKNVARDSIEI